MFALRRSQLIASRGLVRGFQSYSARMVQIGDKIPHTELKVSSPDDKFDLASKVLSGKNIIIGVPLAFSGPCSNTHIPGFIKQLPTFQSKGYDKLYVVAVNDAFVIGAWAKTLVGEDGNPDVTILGDPELKFVKELDLAFDGTEVFGNWRSKRFALLVEDGKVAKSFVEPDNTSIDVSEAEKVVKAI